MRVGGKLHRLHVAATERAVHYRTRAKRGGARPWPPPGFSSASKAARCMTTGNPASATAASCRRCATRTTQAFCILRSIWETSKLNGQNPFEVLREALSSQPE